MNGDVVVTAREIHVMDEERLAVHVHRVRVGGRGRVEDLDT